MRLEKIRIKGITRYGDESLEIGSIPGDIIAICGHNGAGKTSLLEAAFASLYRFFPSRGSSIYSYCHGRDAQIEMTFSFDGVTYRSLLNIDAEKRKMKAYLFEGDRPASPEIDGNTDPFDNLITKKFGNSKLVLASVFADQKGKGSFIQLSKADRKSLFISMLGFGYLDEISMLAAEHKNAADIEAYRLSVLIQFYSKKAHEQPPDIGAITARISALQEEILGAEELVSRASEHYTIVSRKVSDSKQLIDRKSSLTLKSNQIDNQIRECKHSLSVAQEAVASLDRLREAVAGLKAEQDKFAALTGEVSRIQLEQREFIQRSSDLKEQRSQIIMRCNEIKRDLQEAEKNLKDARRDAAEIDTVPCHAEGECAKCKFLVRAISGRDNLAEYAGNVDSHKALTLSTEQELKSIPAADLSAFNEMERRLLKANAACAAVSSRIKTLTGAERDLARAEAESGKVSGLGNQVNQLEQDRDLIRVDLDNVESQLREAAEASSQLKAAAATVDLEKEVLDALRARLKTMHGDLAVSGALVKQIALSGEEVQKLTPLHGKAEQDRKSYDLLTKAFGKMGIQSLEIDNAGPTVGRIANDLLMSCFGSRFAVKLITQKLKADGSGYTDDFDIYVYDEEAGREGSIDDLSVGEQVIVNESVRLAIALFNKERSDIIWDSLFRDEAASSLDDEKAPRYITMLRRARELGQFRKVYLIAHQPRVMGLADARINVSNGKFEIVY